MLRRCLKTATDGADVTWADRSFQTAAPETQSVRLLTVEKIQPCSWLLVAETAGEPKSCTTAEVSCGSDTVSQIIINFNVIFFEKVLQNIIRRFLYKM